MSDFKQAVKYLDRVKGRSASEAELRRSGPNLTNPVKYLSTVKSRSVKKIPTLITIPAHTYDKALVNTNPVPRLLSQLDVNLLHDFYILSGYEFRHTVGGALCIKYREGEDVFRYR